MNSKTELANLAQKLKRDLAQGQTIEVVFVKSDGTERTMKCTRNFETITSSFSFNEKQPPMSDPVIKVFDIDIGQWRSFNINKVLRYRCL